MSMSAKTARKKMICTPKNGKMLSTCAAARPAGSGRGGGRAAPHGAGVGRRGHASLVTDHVSLVTDADTGRWAGVEAAARTTAQQ